MYAHFQEITHCWAYDRFYEIRIFCVVHTFLLWYVTKMCASSQQSFINEAPGLK